MVLTVDCINQRQLEIEIGDGDIDYIQEASGENFAQSAEIFHENTIPEKDNVIYEGSITDYITFRNNDVILGESDLRLVLTQPISELKNITLFAYTNNPLENDVIEINLNDYIYEKKAFNSLNFDGGKGTQAYSVYWQYKSNEILGFSQTYGGIFETSAIERIYADIYGLDVNILEPSQWGKLLFKVEYIPYYETMRSIQYREDFEPYALSPDMLDQFSGLLINQGERINELYDLTENVYGQIQRIGVDTISTSKKHYHFSEVYNYGDYTTDGYIVTKVEIIPYTTYLIARYEFSKNWNRIAQFIQIDKEFRPYEVSLTKSAFTLKRDVLINVGFVEISNEKVFNTDTNNYSTVQGIFMNTFKTGTYLTNNIAALKIRTPYSIDSLAKPTITVAEKNMFKWKVDFLDTKLAGKRVTPDVEDLIGILSGRRIQKGVYYTNENGELETIKMYLHNGIYDTNPLASPSEVDIAKQIADNFPLVDVSSYAARLINPIYELPDYAIKKDSAEVLGLELYMPVIPRYDFVDTFVIGDSLLKENVLIRKRTVSKTLWFYGLTNPIEKTKTDTIDLSSATLLGNISSSIYSDRIVVNSLIYDNYDYYAIADTNGNLYLGVNQVDYSGVKTDISTIYFNFLSNKTLPPIVLEGDDINYNQSLLGGFNIGGDLDYDIQVFFNGQFNF